MRQSPWVAQLAGAPSSVLCVPAALRPSTDTPLLRLLATKLGSAHTPVKQVAAGVVACLTCLCVFRHHTSGVWSLFVCVAMASLCGSLLSVRRR